MKRNKLPLRVAVLLMVSLLLPSASPAIAAAAAADRPFVSRAVSPGTSPEDASPSDAIPSDASPSDTIPSDTIPSDASPSDGIFGEDILFNDLAPVATASQADIPIVRIEVPLDSELLLLSQDGDVQELLDADPALSMAIAYTETGRVWQPVTVVYDTEEFDCTAPGFTFLEGTVVPHTGYSIDEETAAVRLPVFLYHAEHPAELPVSGFAHVLTPPLTVYTTDDSVEEILHDVKRQTTLTYRVADAYNLTIPMTWDASEVLTGTPGTYPLYAVPDLPDGLTLPGQYSVRAASVTVQQPGVLALASPVLYHSNLVTLWQEDLTPDETLLTLWYAVEDGPWTPDDSHTYTIGSLSGGKLYFNRPALIPETSYYFQLEYDGMLSNILRIVPEEGEFRCSDVGGDRDAVDRTPQKPPAVIQPPPVENLPDKNPPDGENPPPGGSQPGGSQPGGSQPGDNSPSNGNSQSGGNSQPGSNSPSGGNSQSGNESQPGSDSPSGSNSQSGANPQPGGDSHPGSHPLPGSDSHPGSHPLPDSDSLPPPDISALSPSDTGAPNTPDRPMPPGVRDVPAPLSGPSAPAMEQDTEDSAVWSRARLLAYLRLNPGKPVVFEKHGVRLSLPADAARDLADSGDFLSAVIKKPDSTTVSIELFLDGRPLRAFPSVTVTLPCAPSGSGDSLSIIGPDGTEITPLYLDSAAMTVSFLATGGGIYTILDTDSPVPQLPGAIPAAILITGVILCLAGLAHRTARRRRQI